MSIRAHAALMGAVVVLGMSGQAMAQSRSSFLTLDALTDLSITQETPLAYRVDVGAAPTLSYLGVTYTVNSVFGFWALSDVDNDHADTTSFGDWAADENLSGAGGISGWKTTPNKGIPVGGSLTFTFDRLDLSDLTAFGMHIRVNETLPTGGNTAYFTVPTPGSLALMSVAAVVLPRRRR